MNKGIISSGSPFFCEPVFLLLFNVCLSIEEAELKHDQESKVSNGFTGTEMPVAGFNNQRLLKNLPYAITGTIFSKSNLARSSFIFKDSCVKPFNSTPTINGTILLISFYRLSSQDLNLQYSDTFFIDSA